MDKPHGPKGPHPWGKPEMTEDLVHDPDPLPDEVMNNIMKELVMYFVLKLGGRVEVNLDDMADIVRNQELGIAALGNIQNQILGIVVQPIKEEDQPIEGKTSKTH